MSAPLQVRLSDTDPRTSLCLKCGEAAETAGTATFVGGLTSAPCITCGEESFANGRYDLIPSTQHRA